MISRIDSNPAPHTRGMVFIHSTTVALCPHIEWAIGAVLGALHPIAWTNQPVQRDSVRMELSWTGEVGTGACLASKLAAMRRIRFEVTEEPTTGSEGHRYAYTPTLGMFNAIVGIHGDIQVSEERIRQAIITDALGKAKLPELLADLLGKSWDSELDIFREASEDAPVRWLHQVV